MGLLNIIPHFQRPMRTFATCFFTSFLGTWFLGSMLMCRNDRFPAWNSWPLPLIVAVCGPILFLNQGDLSLFWKSFHIMCSQKLILQVHPILYTFPVFPCFFFLTISPAHQRGVSNRSETPRNSGGTFRGFSWGQPTRLDTAQIDFSPRALAKSGDGTNVGCTYHIDVPLEVSTPPEI